VCNAFLGWDQMMAAWIGIAVIAIYTTLGGLWAVMATDMVQVALVALGIFVMTPIALGLAGGFESVINTVPPEQMHVFPQVDIVDSPRVWVAWFASWCLIGIGSIVSPDLMQRAFAAKTASIARNSALVGMCIKIILSLLMILLAYTGWTLIHNGVIEEAALHGDVEQIVPVMVKTLLPTPLVILFVGACLSAVMGAASSALLAMSGMISKNVLKDVIRPSTTDRELVVASRVCVVAFSIFAVYLALSLEMVYLLLALGFDLIMASLFAAMTLGLYWRKANEYGAIAGIIAGIGTRVIGAGIENGFTLKAIAYAGDWYVWTLAAPITAFVVMIVVSLATQKMKPSNEYGFHYDADGDPIYKDGRKVNAIEDAAKAA
jgi:Na+/proline symporter